MAVYYKFKSAKDYDSIPMDGHFMSVAHLKERIFESKHLGRGTDFDLVVTNAQSNEEYHDEAMLIPKNTSVLIRRVPGRPRMPIVAQPDELVETKIEESQPINNNAMAVDSFVLKDLEAPEWDDDFGNDLYATIPEMKPTQVSNSIQDAPAPTKADEDSKIRALIETPALDWQRQAEGFGSGRGSGRGGRMMGGRGIGRGMGILERKTPPQGYICHRCKVPGHFIQHCPTNGDPNYDIRRSKPPTGIPKSMLMATPDGSYALPSGASAVLRPNEAAFEKEIEGLPTSSRPVGDVPPELRCPLCKDVMKDAVLTSKCCFTSFCDKCIRDHIISKSMCICGANNILADDLLPNRTLRNTINGILDAKDVSGDNAGSGIQVPDMESARPKAPSPTLSAASKGEQAQTTPTAQETSKTVDIAMEERPSASNPPGQPQLQLNQPTAEGVRTAKIPDVSEATHESASARDAASQGSAPPPNEEEVQQKIAAAEGKKKKKKKARLPVNSMPMESQWRNPQDFAAENYMMQQMAPAPYNKPYWDGMQMQMQMQMQPGMESYMAPFPGCPMPYNNMGFGMGPMDVPFGGVFPHDPFMGQNLMFPPPPFVRPPPPQRDLADFGMGFNHPRPPLMSREEFEARKADLRRKREMERMGDREMPMNMMPRDRDRGREVSSSANGPLTKPKLVNRGPTESSMHDHHRQDDELPNRPNRGGLRQDDEFPNRQNRNGVRQDRISPERGGGGGNRSDRISPERGGRQRLDRISPERGGGHRSDRISPERSQPDPDHFSRKRKSSSDHRSTSHRRSPSTDTFEQRDRHDSSEHHHQHRPRSSSKPPSAAASEQVPSHPLPTAHKSSSSAEDKQHKKSVFSRISFPEGGVEPANKKRKSSLEPKSSKDRIPSGSGSHATVVSNGYSRDASPVVTRKSQQIRNNYIEEVDYESSDDDRHFKRRPSRYEPSPPTPRMTEMAMEMDGGGKRSKRDRDRGGHHSRHRS